MFPFSTKHEIRHFHVVVVQQRLRNVQKSVMHVQSCCCATIKLLLFCCSRCRRCRRLSSLFSWRRRRLRKQDLFLEASLQRGREQSKGTGKDHAYRARQKAQKAQMSEERQEPETVESQFRTSQILGKAVRKVHKSLP